MDPSELTGVRTNTRTVGLALPLTTSTIHLAIRAILTTQATIAAGDAAVTLTTTTGILASTIIYIRFAAGMDSTVALQVEASAQIGVLNPLQFLQLLHFGCEQIGACV